MLHGTRFLSFVSILVVFLASCASRPQSSTPLASSNTSGTTWVNGIEVNYEYNGEFYILSDDMAFFTLEDLRSYVASPFEAPSAGGELETAQIDQPDGFLIQGRQWPNGVIPFQIQDYSVGSAMYNTITSAMVDWQQKTGIRFVPYTGPLAKVIS